MIRSFRQLTSVLPDGFNWSDPLSPHDLEDILNRYDGAARIINPALLDDLTLLQSYLFALKAADCDEESAMRQLNKVINILNIIVKANKA